MPDHNPSDAPRTNWRQEVLKRLADLSVEPARHASIVDEVAQHLEDRHRSLMARGISDDEADRAVMQELSDSDVLQRRLQQVERRVPGEPVFAGAGRRSWVEALWQDVRYGARTLRRSPGFTAVAAIALALGVGANTAIFSVVNTVMLRPLPYPDGDRLVRLWESNPAKGWPRFSASHPTFLDWQAQNTSFERLAAQTGAGFTLTSGNEAQIVRAIAVSADFLPVLGIAPALGRNFRPDEDRRGGNTRVAILTHPFWQRRFGGQRAIVGGTVTLDNQAYEVIGVMPESFGIAWGGAQLDLLVPLAPDPARSRSDHRLAVVGRLKPGVTLEQAHSEMNTLAARIAATYPASNEGWSVVTAGFYDWLVPQESRESLLVMTGAVGLVLLIGCSNVASLLLARASSRQREFSVRVALGAQRSRIIRQWLTESMLLGLLAAALGILLAFLTTRLVLAAAPTALPRLDELSMDLSVVVFGVVVSLVASALFGMAPAIHGSHEQLGETLKEGGRGASGSRAAQRLRAALVIAEVALSVALLIGAGLLIRSFWRLQQVNPGFETEQLATMRISLPRTSYDTNAKSRQFYDRLLPQVAALPGVQAAATSSGVPLFGGNTSSELTIPGKTFPDGVQPSADWRNVSPGYFAAMGIPLRGRDFTEADAAADAKGRPLRPATIISEEMARRYWPGEEVLGKTVVIHSFGGTYTIIGVAGDVRSSAIDADPNPVVYASAQLFARWNPMHLVVRSAVDPSSHLTSIRAAVREIDPMVPVYDASRLTDLVSTSLTSRRFNMYLLICFAVIAVALASIGLFGVLAYLVAQRTRDIGIRMALGADRREVFRLIIGHGMLLASAGVVLGVAGGFAAGRVMGQLLYSVTPRDPATFIAVPALLLLVALVACYAPARRATRVDPLTALRAE